MPIALPPATRHGARSAAASTHTYYEFKDVHGKAWIVDRAELVPHGARQVRAVRLDDGVPESPGADLMAKLPWPGAWRPAAPAVSAAVRTAAGRLPPAVANDGAAMLGGGLLLGVGLLCLATRRRGIARLGGMLLVLAGLGWALHERLPQLTGRGLGAVSLPAARAQVEAFEARLRQHERELDNIDAGGNGGGRRDRAPSGTGH